MVTFELRSMGKYVFDGHAKHSNVPKDGLKSTNTSKTNEYEN